MSNLVLIASPASGKTTFISDNSGSYGGYTLKDSDDIVAESVGWPSYGKFAIVKDEEYSGIYEPGVYPTGVVEGDTTLFTMFNDKQLRKLTSAGITVKETDFWYYGRVYGINVEKCFFYDSFLDSFSDQTSNANNNVNDNVKLTSDPPYVGDYFYIGKDQVFDIVEFNISTVATGGTPSLFFEYYNGTSWSSLITYVDNLSNFTQIGEYTYKFANPGDWTKISVNGSNKYWVRVAWNTGGAPTTKALAKRIRMIQKRVYTSSIDKALFYNGTTYTDETTDANNDTTDDVNLNSSTPTTNDIFYFGDDDKFNIVILDVSTAGTGGTAVWEYFNGSVWKSVNNLVDNTSGFTNSGENLVSFVAASGWQKTTINSVEKYWIRVKWSSAPSVQSKAKRIITQYWSKNDDDKVYLKLKTSITNQTDYVNDDGDWQWVRASQIVGMEIAPATFPTSPDLGTISDNWWKPSGAPLEYSNDVNLFLDYIHWAIDEWLQTRNNQAVFVGLPLISHIYSTTSNVIFAHIEIAEQTNIDNMNGETDREDKQEVYQSATLQDIRSNISTIAGNNSWNTYSAFDTAIDTEG